MSVIIQTHKADSFSAQLGLNSLALYQAMGIIILIFAVAFGYFFSCSSTAISKVSKHLMITVAKENLKTVI